MKGSYTKIQRNRVAREAALLLYTSQEKEYKQAKKRAAENLGVRVLPSNIEVADELDRIAEEREGASRKKRLLRMRREAYKIMNALKDFNPRLMGSVWRGTARQNSDIDVVIFCQDQTQVLKQLQKYNFAAESSEWCSVTKEGRREGAFHIHLALPSGDKAEIVVRSPECIGEQERCETYGDTRTGLNLTQLTEIIKENPLQKFVPKKRIC